MSEPLSRRAKRVAWACADISFHLAITLAIVVINGLEWCWDVGKDLLNVKERPNG